MMHEEHMMEPDYPAAHSADTQWFAVDRDGHVASFYSREAGAVPVVAVLSDSDILLAYSIQDLPKTGQVIYDLRGRREPSEREEGPHFWMADHPVLLFLSSLEPLREVIASGRAIEVPATEGKAVVVHNPTEEELHQFEALPEFLDGFALFGFGEEGERSLARSGFYVYNHLTENWISGPYGREMIPAQPLHVDQLPPALRRYVARLRLENVRFADTPHIQPLEHTECESWESAYLDVNCKRIRPIPGKEEEYAKNFDSHYVDAADDYEVEPPPESE
jgi:hypothetical protein